MARAPFSPARPAGVAVTVIGLAAAAAATGFAMHALQYAAATVAGVLLLCCLAALAARSLWRRYAGPAVRGARLLASAAGHGRRAALPLDVLAAQVRERLEHFERSHRRLQAVISDLPHGVLVFDGDGTLLEINGAGVDMLGAAADTAGRAPGTAHAPAAATGARPGAANAPAATGREPGAEGAPAGATGMGHGAAHEPRTSTGVGAGGGREAAARPAVERLGLADVARRAMRSEDAEVDIPIHGAETRWLHARGRPFAGSAGERGALVVLHDVTRLHHLEQVRRDFVDNVSHELRTPFTLVSGFAETLLDGDMCPNPEARHFLEIIHKHSARVSAIIDDLLLLADIERAEDGARISFDDSLLAPVIAAARLSCGRTAEARGVALHEACEAGLTCRMNALLIEQAVTNLVDNAIKYSNRDTPVTVRGRRRGGDVVVEVIDTGVGIAPEHQQRIFERFYRVDAARSRDSGGTGLGLAIVKHIAQVHGGEVTVRSEPGAGSTFTLRLPG